MDTNGNVRGRAALPTLLVTSHPDRDAFAAERSQLLGLTELPAPAADLSHVFHLF